MRGVVQFSTGNVLRYRLTTRQHPVLADPILGVKPLKGRDLTPSYRLIGKR